MTKYRTLSLDDESEAILMQRAGEVGNVSLAGRQLLKEAQGNHQSLRHNLRGRISAMKLWCRLLREGIDRPGAVQFVGDLEKEIATVELLLAPPLALDVIPR